MGGRSPALLKPFPDDFMIRGPLPRSIFPPARENRLKSAVSRRSFPAEAPFSRRLRRNAGCGKILLSLENFHFSLCKIGGITNHAGNLLLLFKHNAHTAELLSKEGPVLKISCRVRAEKKAPRRTKRYGVRCGVLASGRSSPGRGGRPMPCPPRPRFSAEPPSNRTGC